MASQLQTLPPLKRFRLLQQRVEEENKENSPPPSMASSPQQLLPAKKRIGSRSPQLLPLSPRNPAAVTYSLPTKKRVRAFPPPNLDGDEFPVNPPPQDGSRSPPLLPLSPPRPAAATYSLPTKKRVCAFPPPDLDGDAFQVRPPPRSPLVLPLDLNAQCDPRSDYEEEGRTHGKIDKKQEAEIDGEEQESAAAEDYDDGVLCAVCGSTDGDPSDPIVFCDGCDLMVHTTCYGAPLIHGVPEGDWFCAECSVSSGKKSPPSCCLCPKRGGGMKPTKKDGVWAHIVCALLIPEVFFEDPDGREGIDCSKVPRRRWREKCYICKNRAGCVMECSEMNCPLAFHITCGLQEELCIEYRDGDRRSKEAIVAGFCRAHTELWEKQQRTGKYKIVARGDRR